jgi:collagenase-like PrtC family protease
MSGRTVGGAALLALAAFMLLGFLRSDASLTSPAAIAALLITAVLPAAAGVALLRGGLTFGGRRSARIEKLRQQTLEAEILRLAMQHGGKLTAVEVATALARSPESAKSMLDSLAEREIADLEVTDRGVIVYSFHDARHVGGKHSSRGILDA